MTRLSYLFTARALADLDEIWLYTVEKWSVEQADRYYKLIIAEIEYICTNTDTGKRMDQVKGGYRASKVKSHIIFFRVNNETVEVVRILHERMDIENELTA
jgi:toxin ParE1/3/4